MQLKLIKYIYILKFNETIVISLSMASLDITIVATSLPSISTEFHSQDNYTWVILAYLLGNTSMSPSKYTFKIFKII